MINVDTETLKQMAALVETANREIDSAAATINKIPSHRDWCCWEKNQIDEYVQTSRKNMKSLQESTENLSSAVKLAMDQFIKKESEIATWFESVEEAISKALAIKARGTVGSVGAAVEGGAGAISDAVRDAAGGIGISGIMPSKEMMEQLQLWAETGVLPTAVPIVAPIGGSGPVPISVVQDPVEKTVEKAAELLKEAHDPSIWNSAIENAIGWINSAMDSVVQNTGDAVKKAVDWISRIDFSTLAM